MVILRESSRRAGDHGSIESKEKAAESGDYGALDQRRVQLHTRSRRSGLTARGRKSLQMSRQCSADCHEMPVSPQISGMIGQKVAGYLAKHGMRQRVPRVRRAKPLPMTGFNT